MWKSDNLPVAAQMDIGVELLDAKTHSVLFEPVSFQTDTFNGVHFYRGSFLAPRYPVRLQIALAMVLSHGNWYQRRTRTAYLQGG